MNEVAINTLKDILEEVTETDDSVCYVTSDDADALKAAIKVLEQHPCKNCIDKEALINELKLGYFNKELQEGKNDSCVIDAMIDWAIRTVKRQPPVTAHPFINKPCISEGVCREDKIKVLDKIRAEIKEKIEQEEFARSVFRNEEKDSVKAEQCTGSIMAYNNVIKLIDKYKTESEVEE